MKDPDHPEPSPDLTRFLLRAQRSIGLAGEVSVRIVGNGEMRRLNRRFRGKNKATDVLSFPPCQNGKIALAGDIAISADLARASAKVLGHSLDDELKILLLHGLLHLAGYDHESDDGEMQRLERDLREKLKLPTGLIERTSFGSPLLQLEGAGPQSSGKSRHNKERALAPASLDPALKRKVRIHSSSGAINRSSPRINAEAPTTLRARSSS
jgi:probable rRNA maturation factor